eukprot:4265820-Pyramimonas_sp.AAC.1
MDPSDLLKSARDRWTAKDSERAAKATQVDQLSKELADTQQQLSRLEAETTSLNAEVAHAQSAVAA